MRAALDRNLQFAALRATVAVAVQNAMRPAFARLLRAAKEGRALRASGRKARERLPRWSLARGISRWSGFLEGLRRRHVAHARRHAHLSSLMRGLRRIREEAIAAQRAQRAARRRAVRQQRTLLVLHARLLLARWRVEHGAMRINARCARPACERARRRIAH